MSNVRNYYIKQFAKITSSFLNKYLLFRKEHFNEKSTKKKAIYQCLTDKHNDNVICFVCLEVVLCR